MAPTSLFGNKGTEVSVLDVGGWDGTLKETFHVVSL